MGQHMSNPDPLALPHWWGNDKPAAKTDADEFLFSDENLFAPSVIEDEADPDPAEVEDAPVGWNYETPRLTSERYWTRWPRQSTF